MAISVVMPALEMAQETGKLLAWRKKEGDRVTKGEPLLEIETDKAVVEVEATGDGILAGVTAHEGAVIPVGRVIAWILLPGEQLPVQTESPTLSARATQATSEPEDPRIGAAGSPQGLPSASPRISPKARRVAKELGVDLSCLRGSGPDGTITTEDVQTFVQTQSSSPVPKVETLSQIGRLMAERTTQSWTTVPHFFLVCDSDASAFVELQKRLGIEIERMGGVRLTLNDLLIALVARVLAKHPRLNASWTGEAIRLNPDVNVGVAMAVKDGVVGAVIRNANVADLGKIAAQRRDLTERARAGRLRPADISGGTFTISNLGMYGVDAFTAIITPPQTAVLAVGRIADRVVAVDGRPGICPMMTLTLSSDHRVVDGATAALFLKDLIEAIRDPEEWLR